jgi:hypothetical protein
VFTLFQFIKRIEAGHDLEVNGFPNTICQPRGIDSSEMLNSGLIQDYEHSNSLSAERLILALMKTFGSLLVRPTVIGIPSRHLVNHRYHEADSQFDCFWKDNNSSIIAQNGSLIALLSVFSLPKTKVMYGHRRYITIDRVASLLQ